MHPSRPVLVLLMFAALGSPPAIACGEGIFSMGDGLRYDGYLAPRPAEILVFEPDGEASDERIAVYRGLASAGHRLTIVSDASRVPEAFKDRRFDVVVADDAFAPALANVLPLESRARQLLVVPGKAPRTGRDTQRAFVASSASLGTWLGALNRLTKD